jgi:hypothetical protein
LLAFAITSGVNFPPFVVSWLMVALQIERIKAWESEKKEQGHDDVGRQQRERCSNRSK